MRLSPFAVLAVTGQIVIEFLSAAFGALMVFDNEPAFLAAANIVSTETFDEISIDTNLGTPRATGMVSSIRQSTRHRPVRLHRRSLDGLLTDRR